MEAGRAEALFATAVDGPAHRVLATIFGHELGDREPLCEAVAWQQYLPAVRRILGGATCASASMSAALVPLAGVAATHNWLRVAIANIGADGHGPWVHDPTATKRVMMTMDVVAPTACRKLEELRDGMRTLWKTFVGGCLPDIIVDALLLLTMSGEWFALLWRLLSDGQVRAAAIAADATLAMFFTPTPSAVLTDPLLRAMDAFRAGRTLHPASASAFVLLSQLYFGVV